MLTMNFVNNITCQCSVGIKNSNNNILLIFVFLGLYERKKTNFSYAYTVYVWNSVEKPSWRFDSCILFTVNF